MEKAEKSSLCGSVKAVVFIVVQIVDRIRYNVSVVTCLWLAIAAINITPLILSLPQYCLCFNHIEKSALELSLLHNNLIGFIGNTSNCRIAGNNGKRNMQRRKTPS